MFRALSPSHSVADRSREGLKHGWFHRYPKEGGGRQPGKECTEGAFRECDPVVLSCAGAGGSDCASGGTLQMDEHGKRGTGVGGDDDGPPQHLKRRS